MAKHESPSALLIISAIDLLLASLVCAVVLFVALVGASGAASVETNGASPQAPMILQVLYRQHTPAAGQPAMDFKIENTIPLSDPGAATTESVLNWDFTFGIDRINEYRWWPLRTKLNAKELTFSGIPEVAYVAVHMGTAGNYYISMRCHEPGWTLTLGLKPLRVVDETCANRVDVSREGPAGTPPKLYLVVSAAAPTGSDWIHLSGVKERNGSVSRWIGKAPPISVPDDVSTAIYTY